MTCPDGETCVVVPSCVLTCRRWPEGFELPMREPEGLYQFAPGSWSGVDPTDLAENLKAMASYIRARDAQRSVRITGPNGRSVVGRVTVESQPSVWALPPIIFDEFRRWRSPWWSRAIAWGIAAWYGWVAWRSR